MTAQVGRTAWQVGRLLGWAVQFGLGLEWLWKFGKTYYGCCEPLHDKLEQLRRVPNLRKISMSPWANVGAAVREIGRDHLLYLKPNPALLAAPSWRPELVRNELETKLAAAKGCNVEIVLNSISTVRREPQRLWQWAEVVSGVAARHS
jgi:hypothetical protein